MNITALRLKYYIRIVAVVASLAFAASLFPRGYVEAAVGGPQECAPSSTCEVGEFLFNDDYTPVTSGATCTITSRYPDGTLHINGQSLTQAAENDGWFSHEFTAPSTTGLYRAQVCCTINGDTMCIDKSFEVKAASDANSIAVAVWGYSNRTLSSFGTLVTDIWSNGSRTLTSGGGSGTSTDNSVHNNYYSTDNRVTHTNNFAEGSSNEEIKQIVSENRLLLERLVNKPIIETYIENGGDIPDLGEKLDQSEAIAANIFANIHYLRSKSQLITSKWNSYTDSELVAEIDALSTAIGKATDTPTQDTFMGQVNWLEENWEWDNVDSITKQLEAISSKIDSARVRVGTRGKSSFAYKEIYSISDQLDSIEDDLGSNTDNTLDNTIWGKIREVSELAKVFNNQIAEVDMVLAEWNNNEKITLAKALSAISTRASTINTIPSLRIYLNNDISADMDDVKLKNSALAIRGVLDTNKKSLARKNGQSVTHTWFEYGSIIFRSVVTNPSKLITQDAEVKFYLPDEIKEEHILEVPPELSVEFDADRNQYYAHGTITLKPEETISVAIRAEDIYFISEDEIMSMKNQVSEFAKVLEGTAYYAQSVTLSSDINVVLDRVMKMQSEAVTPEQKIQAYREGQLMLLDVQEKMLAMQNITTQAGSASALMGFVGGAGAIALWGMILSIAAGFVGITVYMRQMRKHDFADEEKKDNSKKDNPPADGSSSGIDWGHILKGALPIIIFGVVTSASSAGAMYAIMSANKPAPQQIEVVQGVSDEASETIQKDTSNLAE